MSGSRIPVDGRQGRSQQGVLCTLYVAMQCIKCNVAARSPKGTGHGSDRSSCMSYLHGQRPRSVLLLPEGHDLALMVGHGRMRCLYFFALSARDDEMAIRHFDALHLCMNLTSRSGTIASMIASVTTWIKIHSPSYLPSGEPLKNPMQPLCVGDCL